MSRAGRRRAILARREANGRGQRGSRAEQQIEKRDQIMGVVLSQPHRRGETSHLAGFVLGRLLLTKQIDPDQFAAGERYAQIAVKHAKEVHGVTYRWPAASISGRIGGRDVGLDPDPDSIVEIERAWSDVTNCLADYGLLASGTAVLARICIMDQEPLGPEDLTCARHSLNVLHRMWAVEPRKRLTARLNYATGHEFILAKSVGA